MTRTIMMHDHSRLLVVRIVVVAVVVAEQFCCVPWWGGGGGRGVRSAVSAFVPAPAVATVASSNGVPVFVVLERSRRISRQQPPLRFSEDEEDDHAASAADNSTTTHATSTSTTSSSRMDDDWRDVRARLIQRCKLQQLVPPHAQGKDGSSPFSFIGQITNNSSRLESPALSTTKTKTTITTTTTNWAYDSGGVIERGSLIVSHPVQDFACGGLRQQYFTKCVVLVVRDDKSFTKGVILNRNSLSYQIVSSSSSSSSSLSPGGRTSTSKSLPHHPWTIYYGGDVQGIDTPETDYTCLHQLKSPLAQEWSSPIVKDIQHTTWDAAKLLVERGEATPNDFVIFAGYVGWVPDRLQEELERGNWFMVATDSKSISDLLANRAGVGQNPPPTGQATSTNNTRTTGATKAACIEDDMGVGRWNYWMERIGKGYLVNNYATTQTFEDNMLRKWIQGKRSSFVPSDHRRTTSEPSKNGLIIQPIPDDEKGLPRIVQGGTIYRAIHPIVLEEQVFHRSLVLILKTDDRGFIGVILNRPSSRVTTLPTTIMKGDEQELAVRYGGRYGLEQEGTPETWLHYGKIALQNARVGVPLGVPTATTDESRRPIIWKCSRQDAETAVEMGLASPSDFLVTWGFTLWEKNRPPQGLRRPLTATRLEDEFKPVHTSRIPRLWQELLQQTKLNEDTLESNLDHAHAAHEMSQSPFVRVTSSSPLSQDDKDEKSMQHPNRMDDDLAEDALRRWIKMFIMGDNTSENK